MADLPMYDPVRIQLLEDIQYKLIDKDVKCTMRLRLDAMVCIAQLRNLIRDIAPVGSANHRMVTSKLSPDNLKMIYWIEYAADEYRKIEERKKAEEGAIAWMGA